MDHPHLAHQDSGEESISHILSAASSSPIVTLRYFARISWISALLFFDTLIVSSRDSIPIVDYSYIRLGGIAMAGCSGFILMKHHFIFMVLRIFAGTVMVKEVLALAQYDALRGKLKRVFFHKGG